jgi:Domain of unknown function (DUF1839)
MVSLLELDPADYRPHPLHGEGRTYLETNCYMDILIELLHARGHEPLAVMGSIVRCDFEGDQWTFFKPPPGDLELLYGIDIHEMQPYRPLPAQAAEQLREDRTMIVELDAWHLPDTAAISYRTEHVKTSCAIEGIDPANERLRYFHNAGLYELEGEDYRGVFRLDGAPCAELLPPYVELVRFDAGSPLTGESLRSAARTLLAHHLQRRPAANPFPRFGEQLARELPALLAGDAGDYHAYAFATARMVGSAFEVGAGHVGWLLGDDGAPVAAAMERIVAGAKALSFKLARRREFDPDEPIATLAAAWEEAMGRLDDVLVRAG